MSKRILLDEMMDERLAKLLSDDEVKHVRDVGLDGIHDKTVLWGAAKQGFDVIVTAEKWYYHDIGNEKKYDVGIVVLRLPDKVMPTFETLAPLARIAKETGVIKQVQKGEMYQVHPSGLVEKVTARQLQEREAKEKPAQKEAKAAKKTRKEENNIKRREEHTLWHMRRPEGVSVEQWNKEFARKKGEDFRQSMAEKQQGQIYKNKMRYE